MSWTYIEDTILYLETMYIKATDVYVISPWASLLARIATLKSNSPVKGYRHWELISTRPLSLDSPIFSKQLDTKTMHRKN